MRDLPPPAIDDAARTEQCGAAIAGEGFPGIDTLLRYRDLKQDNRYFALADRMSNAPQ
jgi:hypothetical protein